MNRSKFVKIVAIALVAILTFTLLAGALSMAVGAASSTEIKGQIEALESEAYEIAQQKEDLQSQIDETEYEEANMVYQKSLIDQQMNITIAEIENTTAQIAQYERLIEEKEAELAQAHSNEDALYQEYKDRLRAMEENGDVTYWAILFKASSFSDLLDRLDMIQEIAEADQEMMEQLSAASAEIQAAQAELIESQEAMEEQKALLAEQQAELQLQSEDAQVLIDLYASESAELKSVYDEYETLENDIYALIAKTQEEYEAAVAAEEAARLAAEEAKRQQELQQQQQQNNGTSSDGTGTSGGDTTSSPSAGSATFIRPVAGGYISSPYGSRLHPVYGYEKFHYGVDYAVGYGTPIYAVASGTVAITSYDASSGNWVMISHNGGFASGYMHMTNYIVSPGQYVSQGQVIGYVGSTGASTGPHLHFAMYHNGGFVNPSAYVPG